MLTSSSLYALNMILTVVVHMYDTRVRASVRVSACVCVLLLLQDKKLRLLEVTFSFSLGTQP